jgi:MFS family permease
MVLAEHPGSDPEPSRRHDAAPPIAMPPRPATAAGPAPVALAALFAAESLGRALLIAVLPVQALGLLGDAQRVSVLFFLVSVFGLFFSFGVPWLVFRLGRPQVFALGSAAALLAQPLFYTETLSGLALGLSLQVVATACVEIPLNLYVLEFVRRQAMGRFEPVRVFFVGAVWAVGPVLGPYLKTAVAPGLPFAVAGAFALVLYAFFRLVGPKVSGGARARPKPPPNPVAYLGRFLAQPRLRLAWLLAFGRNCLWNVLFVYAPLYAVTSGLGEVAGGAIISAGTASLFLVPFWGWLARRHGFRRMLIGAFLAAGAFNIAMIAVAQIPALGAVLLVLSAYMGGVIDACGNAHYLRAVHAHERSEMTAVFTTHRHLAHLAPPGAFALVLAAFELPAVFVVLGVGLLATAHYARYLPKRF